jgi:crossover junction endodeoxyribonuclease RusA
MTFTLPLPPKALSPNARVHWRPKARAIAEYRAAACLAGWEIPARLRPTWAEATAQLTFYFRTKRRRDRDNLAASMKAAFDGLVDAGILADDAGLHHEPVRMEIDRERPRVEITIRPLVSA